MKLHKLTIRDVPLEHKKVLIRVDYNVPLDDKGNIDDDFRIKSSLPTIRYLLDLGCTLVLISHLGRPNGAEKKFSLEPAAQRLAELLGQDVRFVDQCTGDKARQAVRRAPKGSITVLENLRFHTEEEANDDAFAAELRQVSGADYFVQDGFGVVHRAHASTDAITHHLPSVAGLLLEKEYTSITGAMKRPERPLVAVLGGAKVSDKIELVDQFINQADKILLGGAMANTFLHGKGVDVGESKIEPGQEETVAKIVANAEKKSTSLLHFPTDVAVGHSLDDKRRVVATDKIASDDKVFDVGDVTIDDYVDIVRSAGTVIWNGTLGVAEYEEFAHGSARLALELASNSKVTSVIGGGDTADFVLHWDSKDGESFTHVSTGGGASLELMAGDKLPGIESLLAGKK